MIAPEKLFNALKAKGVGIFAGVPDSLLKSFCAYIDDYVPSDEHIITANEGNAIAIAAGYHLATGKVGAVYMQNSGLGNAINPLTSITDAQVYRIPVLMIIGWRGEPGVKDEPQHIKQGKITKEQLELLDIPYRILEADSDTDQVLNELFSVVKTSNSPVALLVRKNTFEKYTSQRKHRGMSALGREQALRQILALTQSDDLIVSTTGKTSREVFELRVERSEKQRDFLTVGGMGHASSIAFGVALGNPDRRVICLDGDGAALMHLGALPVIARLKPENLLHILLNNAAHESVGGQSTVADEMDFGSISKACGYNGYYLADDLDSLISCWEAIAQMKGPVLLEVRICLGSRADLGRPTTTPEENKYRFMEAAGV